MSLFALVLLLADVRVAPPVFGPSARAVFETRVASDGSGFVVANGTAAGIDLVHVDEGWPAGLPALHHDGFALLQDLVATRDGYLLAYTSVDGVHVADLDSDGRIRAERPLTSALNAALAAHGDRALAVTQRGTTILLDTHGNPIRGETPFVASGESYSMSAAANARGFAIVWMATDETLRAQLMSLDGENAGTPITLGPSNPVGASDERPAIATDGNAFLVVWPVGNVLYAAKLGEAPAAIATAPDRISHPHVAWDGARYVIVYAAANDVYTLRVGETAELLAAGERRQNIPDVASSSAGTLFVWRDQASCFEGSAVYGRLDADTLLLTPGEASQRHAVITSLARAWIETSDRVTLQVNDGTRTFALDENVIDATPALATNGESVLIAWLARDAQCKQVVRIAHGDHLLPFTSDIASPPALSWNGSEYTMVWERPDNELRAIRIARDGTLIDDAPRVLKPAELPASASYIQHSAASPSLVWNGSEYLLVWNRIFATNYPLYTDPPPKLEIRTERVSRELQPIGAVEVLTNEAVNPVTAGTLLVYFRHTLHARIGPRDIDLGATTASAVAAATDNGFVVASEQRIFRIAADGGVTEEPSLPPGAHATSIAVIGTRVLVAYDVDSIAYLRDLSVPPRRRRAA